MPKMIIKVRDKIKKRSYYVQWSTISDSPEGYAVYTTVGVMRLCEELGYDHKQARKNLESRKHCTNINYTVGELLSASDEYRKIADVVEYCKENFNTF